MERIASSRKHCWIQRRRHPDDVIRFVCPGVQYSRINTFNQLIISMLVTVSFSVEVTDPKLSGNVNLRNASSVRWNVSVPDDELAVQQNYVLRFLTALGDHSGFSSPGFLIQ
ncbi:uncharacterized protein PAC_17890 [Phialocephala subalpina]|uniref:Uncharacterized protein n=1 Tax=Phialocephala subalpina TaxID=576137 RepID=A0A1L7XSG2_9HELO|nr:uncharacterized protein PAC_17890 [Phialocephala subalpina]